MTQMTMAQTLRRENLIVARKERITKIKRMMTMMKKMMTRRKKMKMRMVGVTKYAVYFASLN